VEEPECLVPEIAEAIVAGARAGAFWKAARLNPDAEAWERIGATFHAQADALLSAVVSRAHGFRAGRSSGEEG
jgi:hypothetical protein